MSCLVHVAFLSTESETEKSDTKTKYTALTMQYIIKINCFVEFAHLAFIKFLDVTSSQLFLRKNVVIYLIKTLRPRNLPITV